MKFLSNNKGQPLLQVKGRIINLNTLEEVNDVKCFRLRPGRIRVTTVKYRNFLYYAGRHFKVKKLGFSPNTKFYEFSNSIKIYCSICGDDVQLIGNYPEHYLKLLGRFLAAAT